VQTKCGDAKKNRTVSRGKKGLAMMKYKAGLHKDVAKIFDSVWIPQTDNIQPAVSTAYKDINALVHPKPLALDNWPEKAKKTNKPQPSSSPWSFFSPKARREKKRLTEISRHLLINLPD
jgi:hypothetical protein